TKLQITAAQPQGRTLQYRVTFGDNSPAATGEIAAPYAALELPHTYGTAGVFRASVTVTRPSGAATTKTVDIAVAGGANTAPLVTLTADPTRGVAPADVQFTITASDRE